MRLQRESPSGDHSHFPPLPALPQYRPFPSSCFSPPISFSCSKIRDDADMYPNRHSLAYDCFETWPLLTVSKKSTSQSSLRRWYQSLLSHQAGFKPQGPRTIVSCLAAHMDLYDSAVSFPSLTNQLSTIDVLDELYHRIQRYGWLVCKDANLVSLR